jgi:hypothetical protein
VETPEFWDAEQFESGAELGLDPQRAYWEIDLDEYGLQNLPAPNPVWICNPMSLQAGEVVSTSTECEALGAEDFIHESQRLIVPVAPSAWLFSDPLNGLYYTEVRFEFGPIPDCF